VIFIGHLTHPRPNTPWRCDHNNQIDKQIAKLAHRPQKQIKMNEKRKTKIKAREETRKTDLLGLFLGWRLRAKQFIYSNKAIHSDGVIHTAAQSCKVPWPFI